MKVRLALAQLNPVVGEVFKNAEKTFEYIEKAEKNKADLILFPELFVTGYPPEDLILKPSFLKATNEALEKIVNFTRNKKVVVVIGFAELKDDIYNSAAIIQDGKLLGTYQKMHLPNYSVFDERRYFFPGRTSKVIKMGNVNIGLTICEDIWNPGEPISSLVFNGNSQLIVNISASPFYMGKRNLRENYLSMKAYEYHCAFAYLNMVGGQDEVVFDGSSFVVNADGKVISRLKSFEEDFEVFDIELQNNLRTNLHESRLREARLLKSENSKIEIITSQIPREKSETVLPRVEKPIEEFEEELFKASVLGVRDYIQKNGFEKVLIGLSGGIDSSLVACIATEALGKDNVYGVLMPSQYTSSESIEDAQQLADNLGIKTYTVPIKDIYYSYLNELKDIFKGLEPNEAEENIQARIRGNILMALSNKFNWLVLTTGNKSEMSVGYATLYGDMAGGFAVIKDIFKTAVYKIARWYNNNKRRMVIPERVFTKPPTAELKPGQTDQDKLPPYEILDEILKLYIEEDYGLEEIIEKGYEKQLVERVIKMVNSSEYKRRQAPPGIKVSKRSLGKDWRMPITKKFLS
ncbi:MAG TPA: NAD+ synthase [Thermotogaceae bacterium]|nr:NAD+ synthase [Thermotogaceae bacterium]